MATSLVSTGVQFPNASAQTTAQRGLTSGTLVNTTSGVGIDFTGIPSWAKRVTLMMSSVSTNGTSYLIIYMGSGGVIETAGYTGAGVRLSQSNNTYLYSPSGFPVSSENAPDDLRTGSFVFTLVDSNRWVINGATTTSNYQYGTVILTGTKTTVSALDRIRVIPANSADAFDSGYMNILYE